MKKLLLFAFAVAFSTMIYAQQESEQIFYEDFSAFSDIQVEETGFWETLYPLGWRTYYGGASNWRVGPGASWAGGEAPELMFLYLPYFVGQTVLTLPPLDLSGDYEHVTISFTQNYNNGMAVSLPTLRIISTLDEMGNDDSWVVSDNNVQYNPGISEEVIVEINPIHFGHPEDTNVRIAICLIMPDSDFTSWSFDNIEVRGYYPDAVAENETRFNVYPNPASNMLNVECETASEISIYNLLGVMVKEARLHEGQNAVAIDELAEGAYFIQMRDNKGNVNTSKFIVRK